MHICKRCSKQRSKKTAEVCLPKKKNARLIDILPFKFDFLLFVGYTICEPYEKENTYAG